ncbi:MAG: bifunctional phosphoribosyl-AMP cyclohydrolase/phosphoribosyl-ATP diphosphatase HisIE [Bacillota bacterium]|nr:bifunctional phosphoribosyl-AMP cyclohydrolase/phosphoribosyl-ATP diphosphatase HisIE [Bacillota bacterium]
MGVTEAAGLSALRFGPDGLLPVVVQDAGSGEVLMLAFADREAVTRTLAEGRAWYFSRARQRLWRKGETSGNTQEVVEVRCDCDGDAVLYRVRQRGPACHTGRRSCFHRFLSPDGVVGVEEGRPHRGAGGPGGPTPEAAADGPAGPEILAELGELLRARRRELPSGSYTASLFRAGAARMAQKVGEEAVEVAVAAVRGVRVELVSEAADLVFHLLVLLTDAGIDPGEVWDELARRRSGGGGCAPARRASPHATDVVEVDDHKAGER